MSSPESGFLQSLITGNTAKALLVAGKIADLLGDGDPDPIEQDHNEIVQQAEISSICEDHGARILQAVLQGPTQTQSTAESLTMTYTDPAQENNVGYVHPQHHSYQHLTQRMSDEPTSINPWLV